MRAFQLAVVEVPMPLMMFWYIGQEVRNPRFAVEAETTQMEQNDLDASNENTRIRVNKWCRDLLEVKTLLAKEQVHFLHRTVKDFLLTREMQDYFLEFSPCTRSPREAICDFYVAHIKAFSVCQSTRDLEVFWSRYDKAIGWARECEIRDSKALPEVWLELDRVRQLIEKNAKGVPELTVKRKQPRNILHLAIRFGMILFVDSCLQHNPGMKAGILGYAILPDIEGLELMRLSSQMVELLLDNGVDPNDAWPSGGTAWHNFLRSCLLDDRVECRPSYLFAETLLRHGADVNATITHKKVKVDVRTCLLFQQPPGRWTGEGPDVDSERDVDRWLLAARASQQVKVPMTPTRFPYAAAFRRLFR